MTKVGITGKSGFVGKHLWNMLGILNEEFIRVDFQRAFWEDNTLLDMFVSQCDVIVHLAAVNRHSDPGLIYRTNVGLVEKLVASLERTGSRAHILFSSSTQEEGKGLYGQSKADGRQALAAWAAKTGGVFTGLVIPNVFGPFGHPYYNSFIATFCYQLARNEQPKVEIDQEVKLIYVGDLVQVMIEKIRRRTSEAHYKVSSTDIYKVSDILSLISNYRDQYQRSGIIPELRGRFEINLFNTFRSYIDIENHFPVKFTEHKDLRGSFVEVIRLNTGGQISFSTTFPGITRGNHFHTRKIERFAVIKGKALIQLRQVGTDNVSDFYLDGTEPAYVDMPVWFTHNIKNIGEEELYTIFWINEFYDPNDPDTYFEQV